MTATTPEIEALAAEIGEAVYLDLAKWHLYLNDAKLHGALAERLYPMLEGGVPDEAQVRDALAAIPVTIGGGRRELPLADFVPAACLPDLMERLRDYCDRR